MRYDDQAYLDAFVKSGVYPKIHDRIFEAIVEAARGTRFLDLGCSTGLLGHRLVTGGADLALGVDASADAIDRGVSAGMNRIAQLALSRNTLCALGDVIETYRLTVLVARRIFPELFGSDLPFGVEFARECYKRGIREVFIEGRKRTSRATNPLSSVDAESELISPVFPLVWKKGEIAYHRAE